MSGNYIGGRKAAKTTKQRKGDDFYQEIGAKGGKAKVPKGFAIDTRGLIEKLMRVPNRASVAGRKGGSISKRGASVLDND